MEISCRALFSAALVLLLILPFAATAMLISVEIADSYKGRSSYFEVKNESYLSFALDWENIGSLDCGTRLAVDLYGDDGRTKRIWSADAAIAPGDSALLEAAYLPETSGIYTANMTLYYCDRILHLKTLDIDFERPQFSVLPAQVSARGTKDKVYFEITPQSDMDSLRIIPQDYPKTWYFEEAAVEDLKAGKTAKVELNYDPVVWVEKNATFALVSDGGLKVVEVTLEEEKKPVVTILQALLALLIVSVLLNAWLLLHSSKASRAAGKEEVMVRKEKTPPAKATARQKSGKQNAGGN
ncbi:MAG: hypothetical protein ACP5E4_02320 [Candidatus Aenigmatarchaeota archaeon]